RDPGRLPIWSMSGSQIRPGRVDQATRSVARAVRKIEAALGWMSPVVRQEFAIRGAHRHGWYLPYSLMEKWTSCSAASMSALMCVNASTGSSASRHSRHGEPVLIDPWHQSYFRYST